MSTRVSQVSAVSPGRGYDIDEDKAGQARGHRQGPGIWEIEEWDGGGSVVEGEEADRGRVTTRGRAEKKRSQAGEG